MPHYYETVGHSQPEISHTSIIRANLLSLFLFVSAISGPVMRADIGGVKAGTFPTTQNDTFIACIKLDVYILQPEPT
jgi:hypothetical protein